MKRYSVTEECIACHACVEIAGDHFEMGSQIAHVFKQPANKAEEEVCEAALNVCPVEAIVSEDRKPEAGRPEAEAVDGAVAEAAAGTVADTSAAANGEKGEGQKKAVLARDNVKEVLDARPELKEVLIGFSQKFNKLLNPVMYRTLARFATFNEAARVSGVSVCEILHVINNALGTMAELQRIMPECIQDDPGMDILSTSTPITWTESADRYIYNRDTISEIIEKVSLLRTGENLVVISVEKPTELVKAVAGLGMVMNIEKSHDYRISIFNPKEEATGAWRERKAAFEQLDVRSMRTDPFDIIIQKAYATNENDGFILIQRFEPIPLINMLSEMGFEHESEQKSSFEVWVYFYKTPVSEKAGGVDSDKTEVVIQSATPVAYPVIMRLLQSETIRRHVSIRELKVWEETEKHLAWITSGKADISFSALITSAKLKNSDIKIPALFVWDNFVILSRTPAKDFHDIIDNPIHTPLFEEAPPARITRYLIKANGLDPDDFTFVYGKPFGRPEQIYADFVSGKADTVILREPEASYALKIMQDRGEEVSILSYNEMWNKVNPGFGSFPNAGIVFKGEFVRNHPELAQTFLVELEEAIDWVNQNRSEAANLSFDMMRQPADRVELFLERVNFNYVSGNELIEKVKNYFDLLVKEQIVESRVDESFYDIFRMEPSVNLQQAR